MQVKEIIQELFYEKTRAILLILAIAWGTFAIVVTLAVGEGLRLHFMQAMANAGDNQLVISPGMTSKNYLGMKTNEPVKFGKRDVEVIAKLPNIDRVSIQYNLDTKITYNSRDNFVMVRAVSPEYALIHNLKVGAGGRFISPLDNQDKKYVIVLGAKIAAQVFTQENPLGKTIYIDNHPFVVIGVMQTKPQMSGTDIPDNWLNWIPRATYELLKNPQTVDKIVASYNNPEIVEHTKEIVRKTIAMIHGFDPSDQGIISFIDLAKEQKKMRDFFIKMQIFLGVVGGLTLFLAGVGIANVMYSAIKRQTRLIGTRMALGATVKDIAWRYIGESLAVTIVGGLIGMILAVVFIYLVRLIPLTGFMIEEVFGKPEPTLSFLVVMIVVLVLGGTGFFAGLLPALKAAHIDPAQALTYE